MDAKTTTDHRKSKRDFRYAESQLRNLNTKIDKLLNKLDEKEQDEAKTPEEECVICVNSKATMQTLPCGHRVVCRKCLVRTIQIAVSRRSLPLRCVVCRARVLRLKRSSDGRTASTPAAASRNVVAATTTSARSHSLPTKLRRHSSAAVAVRSRSVGTGKAVHRRQWASGGGRRKYHYVGAAAGWAEAFTTDEDGNGSGGGRGGGGDDDDDHNDDDDDDDDDDEDDDDDDEDDDDRYTTAVKYSKLDSSATDLRRDNQSKNGLQRILGKFKFWRFLRFKNNKP